MRRFLRWAGFTFAGLVTLLAAAAVYVFAASSHEINRTYADVPLVPFTASSDAQAIERGRRLATIYGCYNSCHGPNMAGADLFSVPNVAHISSPNLTQMAREYTDSQFERVIRHGVKRDGTSTWIMPAQMFNPMSDRDLADILAFIRSVPVSTGTMRDTRILPLGRLGVVLGKVIPIAKQIDHAAAHPATTEQHDVLKYGEYLVKTSCTECHGQNLQGTEFAHAPNLAISAAYSDADFTRLMRTGVALGDRKVGLMTEVAETRFFRFSDEDIIAVRTYLNSYVAAQAKS